VALGGKELADHLAIIGHEPACSVSTVVARDWTIRDHRKPWDSLSGLKQAKVLIQGLRGVVKIKQKVATMGDRAAHRIKKNSMV
jgi:hypothetical protein